MSSRPPRPMALCLAGTQAERLAVAQAEIAAAQQQLAEVQVQVAVAETAVAQRGGVLEAQTQVAAAQLALEKRSLTAPFSGTVADVLVDVGETVTAGQPVAIVADLSGWQVETSDLIEADVVAIARDDVARVQVDAFADESLTGGWWRLPNWPPKCAATRRMWGDAGLARERFAAALGHVCVYHHRA